MRKKWLTAALCLAAVLTVGGCKNDDSKTEAQVTETPTPEPTQEAETLEMTEVPEFGEKTETSQSVKLTNETGAEVTSVWVRVSGQEEWGEELLQGQAVIPETESGLLHYEPQQTAEDGTAADVEAWDLSVGYADGSYVVMNQIDLGAADEMTMCWEDDLAFVTYVDQETQEEVSTKEQEIARREAEAEAAAEAAAQAEAERQAAEEAAAAQAEAERQAAEEAAAAQAAAEAAAQAEAERQAAEAAAAQQAAEEAAAAAAAQQQQQQQQQQEDNCANSSGNIVMDENGNWYVE